MLSYCSAEVFQLISIAVSRGLERVSVWLRDTVIYRAPIGRAGSRVRSLVRFFSLIRVSFPLELIWMWL